MCPNVSQAIQLSLYFGNKVACTNLGENCAANRGEKPIYVSIAVIMDSELCCKMLRFTGTRVFQKRTGTRHSSFEAEGKYLEFNGRNVVFCKY